jgi:hypothetical protein
LSCLELPPEAKPNELRFLQRCLGLMEAAGTPVPSQVLVAAPVTPQPPSHHSGDDDDGHESDDDDDDDDDDTDDDDLPRVRQRKYTPLSPVVSSPETPCKQASI